MSSSEDEGDLFGRLESDGLFDESDEQQRKRAEAQHFVDRYAQRDWGLAARQQAAVGSDREAITRGSIALNDGKVVAFCERQGQQAKVWDCALVMAKFLDAPTYFPKGFFADKRVLELGCGIGVPGLAAAVLGSKEVVLTDLPMAVSWIQVNIDENRAGFTGNVSAEPLMWGEEPESAALQQPFDVILCSDLVYGEPSISHKLVSTLHRLSHSTTLIVSAHEARFAGDRGASFFDRLRAERFAVEPVPMDALDAVYRAEGIHVHLIHPPAI